MRPIFFSNQSEFRKWLRKNHAKETELLVGYYKVESGKPSMTWPQSVDEALCFGWIDGVRKSLGREEYCIRFTPRRPASNWSAVNKKKAAALIKQGRMQPAGLAAYKKRTKAKSDVSSYGTAPRRLTAKFEKNFKKEKEAWGFFRKQAPSFQKTVIHWIMTAKQETTKRARFEKAINAFRMGKRMWSK